MKPKKKLWRVVAATTAAAATLLGGGIVASSAFAAESFDITKVGSVKVVSAGGIDGKAIAGGKNAAGNHLQASVVLEESTTNPAALEPGAVCASPAFSAMKAIS